MPPTRFSVEFFTTYMLLIQAIIRGDCLDVMNGSEKINSNLDLWAAVNFVIKSVNCHSVRVIGCNSYLHENFMGISEHWRTSVTLTLMNVEEKYEAPRKVLQNEFILMLVDEDFNGYLPKFMLNIMGRIRKHRTMVILKTKECESSG